MRLKTSLNNVGRMINPYYQNFRGSRIVGKGMSLQYLPKYARNLFWESSCIYIDIKSSWSCGLLNVVRVLNLDVVTNHLTKFHSDPDAYRKRVADALISGSLSQAKNVIIKTVHGIRTGRRALFRDEFEDVWFELLALSQEVEDACNCAMRHPLFRALETDLLAKEQSKEQEVKTFEALAAVALENNDVKPKRARGRPKKESEEANASDPVHQTPLERELLQENKLRLWAIYQMVESEIIQALQEFSTQTGFETQAVLSDGMVLRPIKMSLETAKQDTANWLRRAEDYVFGRFGWRCDVGTASLELTATQKEFLAGPKVFNSLKGLARCSRTIVYHLGEIQNCKRFGRAVLHPSPIYEGLYEPQKINGETLDIKSVLDPVLSQHAGANYLNAKLWKEIESWFEDTQDPRFEILHIKGNAALTLIRYRDGMVQWDNPDNQPRFRNWDYYKSRNKKIPVHFKAFPDTDFMDVYARTIAIMEGQEQESPTPMNDAFLFNQMSDVADHRVLRILYGRTLFPPGRDKLNIWPVIIGPEQIGKSLMMGQLKEMLPLSSQIIKVITSKSSDRFMGLLPRHRILMLDEAECLVSKIGFDVAKAIVTNGPLDVDVKFQGNTDRAEGSFIHLIGVGNSLFENVKTVDKAFVERTAMFTWNKIIDDEKRDPKLDQKLRPELGSLEIRMRAEYLFTIRSPHIKGFWADLSTPHLLKNRYHSKVEGDIIAQFFENFCKKWTINIDANYFETCERIEEALGDYHKEKNVDYKPRAGARTYKSYIQQRGAEKGMRIVQMPWCSYCRTIAKPEHCGAHYSTKNVREYVQGIRLVVNLDHEEHGGGFHAMDESKEERKDDLPPVHANGFNPSSMDGKQLESLRGNVVYAQGPIFKKIKFPGENNIDESSLRKAQIQFFQTKFNLSVDGAIGVLDYFGIAKVQEGDSYTPYSKSHSKPFQKNVFQ